MKNKTVLALIVLCGSFIVVSAPSWAVDETTFTVKATVPTATSVSITAYSVNSTGTPVFTPVVGTLLDFSPLTFNAINQIYLPDHFFAIDLAPVGGAASPNVTATFTQGANPNNPAHGLGWKSTATFIKVTGPTGTQVETGLATHGPKKLLKDLTGGENIGSSETAGGFLRIYLGIVTLDPGATFPDPAGSETFSNADLPGDYDGTFLVSATIP